ncbi:phosphatase PAP2 family protein [Microbacterium stercoris]|uniref:Phosphatase PAP2 family protein n=1 Tax=Microbacterium stercoris TaxID=2820289 RepID=A0A939TS44_9MICO|nr:phosphatase PAP2 family protein [Microbacterium stercoris]MBO3664816.1 phosphatase PAP2 family protein [Microbacterium stercoris]
MTRGDVVHERSEAAPGVLQTSRRWVIAMALSAVVLAATYLLAVWTERGQAIENAALRGADQVRADELAQASETLAQITIWSLGIAVVLVAVVALLRRRLDLAVAAVGIIVLGQVITQSLKRFVLPRPQLVEVVGEYTQNSFPSGHTTIAMTVLFAALIVVPYRWRGVTLFVVMTWAIGIGAYTVTAKWHRFSDTLGADAVALTCGCLAAWWLTRRGAIIRYAGRPLRGRVVLAILVGILTAFTLVCGALLWGIPMARGVDASVPDLIQDYNAYLGSHALASGTSGLAALLFWRLWHRLEVAGRGDASSLRDDTDLRKLGTPSA